MTEASTAGRGRKGKTREPQLQERPRPVAGLVILISGILLIALSVPAFIKVSWDAGLVLLAFAAVWIACGIGMRRYPEQSGGR